MLEQKDLDSKTGTRSWSSDEAIKYEASRHGPDGKLFLDPLITNFLILFAKGRVLIDGGTGAGQVALEAAEKGAVSVYACDLYPAMIARAQGKISEAEKEGKIVQGMVKVSKGDVTALPYENEFAGGYLSVNVACNLDAPKLADSFREMRRVLKTSGVALGTYPINLGEIFTNGDTDTANSKLITALKTINSFGEITQDHIREYIGSVEQIHRATFAVTAKGLGIVVDDPFQINDGLRKYAVRTAVMQDGQEIWRKLPGLVVPNNWHTVLTYETLMKKACLTIAGKHSAFFTSEAERLAYNDTVPQQQPALKLGQEFVGKGPFAVYILEKN